MVNELENSITVIDENKQQQQQLWESIHASEAKIKQSGYKFTIVDADSAVARALKFLNPVEFTLKREPMGDTILYDIFLKGEIVGRYSIERVRGEVALPRLNWFSDERATLRLVIIAVVLSEIEKILPNGNGPEAEGGRKGRESEHYAHPPEKRKNIAQAYKRDRNNGDVMNKDTWAQSNYQISGKTLNRYLKEFPENGT